MSYNVHRGIGGDGRLSLKRIADLIVRYRPDVAALQELDIGHARTDHADQPEIIAKMAGMHYCFFPAVERIHEHYGDAILSRHRLNLVRAATLPTLSGRPSMELRGALWTTIDIQGVRIQIVNTHLGYNRRECLMQAQSLLGPTWLGHPHCRPPLIVCGDFNAWPGTLAYQKLGTALRDSQEQRKHTWRRNTFPARCPLVSIDHVFHSPDLRVISVNVPRNRLTRIASDHLPIIVELELP